MVNKKCVCQVKKRERERGGERERNECNTETVL